MLLLAVSAWRAADLRGELSDPHTAVGLLFDPATLDSNRGIHAAYEAVLDEEGIPHSWISTRDLLLLEGDDLAGRFEALIFPDALVQAMPAETLARTQEFMKAGGDVAVILDPGIKDTSGAYRSGGVLAPIVGVQYQRYRQERDRAYVRGRVDFENPAVTTHAWGIPPGKLYQGHVVGGYTYGGLDYPIASATLTDPRVEVFAHYRDIPILSTRTVGDATALWVNLPLGYLKSYGDDLPLRAFLRNFLLNTVRIPHLVPAPGGVGGIVMDWHIDSSVEWEGIPAMIKAGVVRAGLEQQFDVTAGPFRDEPGDGLGFDACGAGRPYLESLLPYGDVGSHGAWSHNWSSSRLEAGTLGEEEFERLVARNSDCLESVTGESVRTYSAPNGAHPQPFATAALERLGVRSYYYTGDTGSAPNRTFHEGRMVSDKVWAFPVMPNGIYASIGEMIRKGLSPADIEGWLNETLEFVMDERTVRLIYSHPYDLGDAHYRAAFVRFLDRIERLQVAGLVRLAPTDYFARFMTRFVATDFSFTEKLGRFTVDLHNAAGLTDVSFAIPAGRLADDYEVPEGVEWVGESGGYVRFVVTAATRDLETTFTK